MARLAAVKKVSLKLFQRISGSYGSALSRNTHVPEQTTDIHPSKKASMYPTCIGCFFNIVVSAGSRRRIGISDSRNRSQCPSYFNDMEAVDIDLTMPWWYQVANETLAFNDKMYFIFADISYNHYESITLLYYNGVILDNNQIPRLALRSHGNRYCHRNIRRRLCTLRQPVPRSLPRSP